MVEVEFPLLPGADWRGQARVERWLGPPPRDGATGDDVAGLVLTGGLPEGAAPARLAQKVLPGRLVDVFGYPPGRPDGGWVEAVLRYEVGGGRLQMDTTPGSALRVQPGYSGSPVCDRRSGQVAGLLWTAPRAGSGDRDSYAITVEQLRSAWPDVLAETGRDVGVVTADLFDADWAQLAGDAQEYHIYPTDPLIGREWLVADIDAFCREHDRGYFVIEGDAGMGKTAFAAWFAQQKQCVAHFAQLDRDAGTSAVAVRNLGAQLIAAWDLKDLAPGGALPGNAGSAGWLRTVIWAAARQRDIAAPGLPILLVVDALDTATEPSGNHLPLGLPDTDLLPGGVYVVVTARTGGLRHAPGKHVQRNLDAAQRQNLADLRQYLAWSVSKDHIASAIASAGMSGEQFTDLLLDRSLGVWIYVRYVLEQIREDPEAVHELPALPRGLEAWYHDNLAALCDGPDGTLYLPLLATLAVAAEPLPARILATLAGPADQQLVEQVLSHALRPYCGVIRLPGMARSRFEVRHPSLREYFTGSFHGPAIDGGESETATQIADVSALRERLADACRDAHHRVCDRYLAAWGGLDQHLPDLDVAVELGEMDGGYALRWLTWHLLAAGREADLHRLLACGPRERNIWFAAHDYSGDVAGYLRDIGNARNAAQPLSLQLRYALIEASIASLSTALPPALLGELITLNLWSPPQAFSYIERMTDEHQQAQALARIASYLPDELSGRALSKAMRCRRRRTAR